MFVPTLNCYLKFSQLRSDIGSNMSTKEHSLEISPEKIMEELDNMMLAGLEDAMTEVEQRQLVSFMISGDPHKLAQAATIAQARTTKMLTSTPRPSTSTSTSTSSFEIRKHSALARVTSMSKPRERLLPFQPESPFRPQSIIYQRRVQSAGYVRKGVSTSSITSRNPSHRASVAGETMRWRRLYPLPIRMARAYSICLDFDPYLKWGCNLSFLDDMESFASFHKPPKNKNVRENIVKDAFERLSVGMWNKNVWKEPIAAHHINCVNNLLMGTSPRQTSTLVVPYRRVIISSVRGPLRKIGIQVGDVVTHVNNEPFDGSAEKLRHIIAQMRMEEHLKHTEHGTLYPKMQIVVNAEIGTAEVLRLRSKAAKFALEQALF